MALEYDGLRWKMRPNDKDAADALQKDLAELSPTERAAVEALLAETQHEHAHLLQTAIDLEYDTPPVDIRTFYSDPYFLGKAGGKDIYPLLLEDLVEFFDGGYHQLFLTGGLGWGKTTIAIMAMLRVLYEANCLKNPPATYGLASGSDMHFAFISARKDIAQRVLFEQISTRLSLSPCFKDFGYKELKDNIKFKKNLVIMGGESSDVGALGSATFSCIFDEGNFMGVRHSKQQGKAVVQSRAELIYNSIIGRMKTRFYKAGKMPGLMCLISSKRTPNDFVEQKIRELKDDPTVFARDYALYQVKADNFSKTTFKVLVGDAIVRSKILQPGEEVQPGQRVIEVPVDFKTNFERDIDLSLRDFSGIATTSIVPFIARRESITEAVDPNRSHPFTVLEWDPAFPASFRWDLLCTQGSDGHIPRVNPEAPRHIHIDAATTSDCLGLCVAHISQWVEKQRGGPGEDHMEMAPEIYVDAILRVVPPSGDQIFLADVRQLIYDLAQHGFHITFVHMDQFAHVEMVQKLKQRGFRAEVVSVDKTTTPYEYLRDALYEHRVKMYPYPTLQRELSELEFDRERNKVDHPEYSDDGKPSGKDCADALAAVAYSLSTETSVGGALPPPVMGDHVALHPNAFTAKDLFFQDESGEDRLLGESPFMLNNPQEVKSVKVQTLVKFKTHEGKLIARNTVCLRVSVEPYGPFEFIATVRLQDGVIATARGVSEIALIMPVGPKYIKGGFDNSDSSPWDE